MAAGIIKTNRLPAKQNEDKWRRLHHFKVDFFCTVFQLTLYSFWPAVIGELMKGIFLTCEHRLRGLGSREGQSLFFKP